jgi:hypothetical protein
MGATRGVLARIREPEYTGENRCLPCTAVNLVIAVVASVALAIVGWQVGTAALGAGLGVGLFGLGVASIYLRGYLVPGTPTLTKEYMPAWLLDWFGKAPAQPDAGESDLDAEAVLTDVGALEECPDRPDLCLTDDFREQWYTAIEAVDADAAGRERLLDLLEADDGEVDIEEFGTAFQARLDGRPVGTWQSEAAFLADLGAGEVLAERDPEWAAREVADRGRLLNGLRLFLDTCPACGGVPEFGTETVESCCSTHEVAAVECGDCGARLFETRT